MIVPAPVVVTGSFTEPLGFGFGLPREKVALPPAPPPPVAFACSIAPTSQAAPWVRGAPSWSAPPESATQFRPPSIAGLPARGR